MHKIHPSLLTRPVQVMVVGAGGTGSQVLTGLAQLHTAMLALGHPGGLDVTVIDDDHVSEANVGRQMFFPSDIGLPKAHVMVNRINATFGTTWGADTRRVSKNSSLRCDLLVGCVDNRAARKAICASLEPYRNGTPPYWMDIGNRLSDGQVILGEVPPRHWGKWVGVRLPHAIDLFPEIADETLEEEDDTPSCSLAEALEKQSLFINRAVALYALNILWELFRFGEISYHGAFVNLKTGRTSPIAVDPDTWARFGYKVRKPRQRKKEV